MWNLKKNDMNKPIYKTKIDSQTYSYQRGRWEDRLGV